MVFLGWNYADSLRKRFNDTSVYTFLVRNALLSYENVTSGRVWTMLTNCFSHSDSMHFVLNSFVLYSFGPAVVQIVGARRFIGLYLASGLGKWVINAIFMINLINLLKSIVSRPFGLSQTFETHPL